VKLLIAVLGLSLCLSGCGYQIAGKADMMPKDLRIIAVPAFRNVTTQYKLSDYLAEAVTRELNTRTKYHVVADPKGSDAVLTGAVANFFSFPTVFDPVTGRGTGVQAILQLQVRLMDKSGKILYDRPNFEIRERYEISTDPKQYFDESPAAMQRLARDAARSIVSAVLEKF